MKSSELARILLDHPDAIENREKLISLLREWFPCEKSLINLLVDAYDTGIIADIKNSDINELLISKSQKKMSDEFSVEKEKALWAINVWCKSYGFEVLHKAINLPDSACKEELPEQNEIIRNIGIDLGTTNTVVSFINQEGELEKLKIGNKFTIPSVMFFDSIEEGRPVIHFGNNALKRCRKNSQSVVKLFKRKIGNTKDKYSIVINSNKSQITENKYYVVDTNCFCVEPDMLEYFKTGDTVYLPITVTNELEFRAKQPETKYSAEKALNNLALSKEKYPCEIVYEESDLSLLPKDFFAPTSQNDLNDDKVLTVAIKHKEQNAILVTNDNKLRGIKAPQCKIVAIKLSDFKLDKLTERQSADSKISLTAEDATSYFLRYIREETCKSLFCDGLNAVITVPVNFNNIQVEATKRAAKNAGFREVAIEKEPVAAAIAYAVDKDSDKKILVYDFGGGTFDVAIVNYDEGKNEFDVLATDGDPKLGGQDITNEFSNYIFDVIADEDGLELYSIEESKLNESEYYSDLQIIENEAERVKQSLSSVDEEVISLTNLFTPDGKGLNKQISITRKEFEDIVSDISRKPTPCIEKALREANLVAEKIDIVIMSGGTSLMPIVKEKVQNFFGKLPFADKNAATLIADGAAIIANRHFSNVAPEVTGGSNCRTSVKDKKGEPIRKSKVVADFGIATEDYNFDTIINSGVQLPATGKKDYYLLKDNQENIDIVIYSRKKNSKAVKYHDKDCEYLDTIHISGLPNYKKKDVVIEVLFEITAEYELKVSAEVKDSSRNTLVEAKEIIINRDSLK